jgi:hypothetical protein
LALSGPRPAASAGNASTPRTAADVLRGYNVPGGVAHRLAQLVEDRAAEDARLVDRSELVERFEEPARHAVSSLRIAGPDSPVPWPQTQGLVRLGEAVRIVLLEAVVHLLDVLDALGRTPGVPEAALRDTVGLLAEVPSQVELIEAATGRTRASPLPVLR